MPTVGLLMAFGLIAAITFEIALIHWIMFSSKETGDMQCSPRLQRSRHSV